MLKLPEKIDIQDRFSLDGREYQIVRQLSRPKRKTRVFKAVPLDPEVKEAIVLKFLAPIFLPNIDPAEAARIRKALPIHRSRLATYLHVSEPSTNNSLPLVANYIEGTTLEDFPWGESFSSERLKNTVTIIRSLLEMVYRLIDARVVHRDIKPQNIIVNLHPVSRTYQANIIDTDGMKSCEDLDSGYEEFLTLQTASPAQILGRPSPWCDLYSTGRTLLYSFEPELQMELNAFLDDPEAKYFPEVFVKKNGLTFMESFIRRYVRPTEQVIETFLGLCRLFAALVKRKPVERPQTFEEAMNILERGSR